MKLSVRSLSKSFGAHAALRGRRLSGSGRSLVLIGPSGGGKSTLLRVLGGLEVPDEGEVAIDGEPMHFEEAWLHRYRQQIGTVFQTLNLFPHLTALENITLPLEKVHGLAKLEARSRAEALLARFQVESHAHKRPAEMSGGQRQRVAIARALSIKPRLLLFDEPTSALDPGMTAEVLQAIEELRAEGLHLILVTHHLAFARRVADQVAFLADGAVLESGPAEEVFASPRCEATRRFLAQVMRY